MTEQRENQKVTNKTGEDARRPAFVQSLAIAASFVLLITGAWIIFSQPVSPKKLYARNFTFHPDLLSREVEDRLSATGFGANWKLLEELKAGMSAYNSGELQQAREHFNAFQTAVPQDGLSPFAGFYEAIVLLKLEQTNEAISKLQGLTQKSGFPLKEDAKWYLALAQIKQNNPETARLILKELRDVEKYSIKADKLFSNL